MIDLNQIKLDVKKVIEYSQNISGVNTEKIINEWYQAKHKWLNYF